MQVAWATFKRELFAYFLSPISYLIAALFLLVHGYSFFLLCQVLSTQKATTGAVLQYFFGGTFLYWIFLMFVVAVLTMRLLAEERQRGTIEPLLTAPVREGALALGKFAAALVFYLFLWAPTLAYAALLRVHAGDPAALDPGPVLAAYLGTFLIGLSSIGLGLLFSALSRTQILSAVLCFTALSMLLLVGMLADLYVKNETLRQALIYVNLFRHMDELARGVVDSRRVVYHLSLMVAALFLAGRVLTVRPGEVPAGFRVVAEAMLCVLLLLGVNVVSARHYRRADWTRGALFSLSERTRDLLADLSQEGRTVNVSVFLFESEPSELTVNVKELLQRAERAARGHLPVEFLDVDRNRERVKLLAERYHVDKDDLRSGVIVVRREGQDGQRKVLLFGDLAEFDSAHVEPGEPPRLVAFRGEEALDGAILSVLTGKSPELCFSKGHGESEHDSMTGRGLSDLTEALHRDNYATRALERLDAVPASCDVLVIAGPERPFLPAEVAAVGAYLGRGGKLLGLLGPLLDPDLTRFLDTGLEDLLRQRGIRLGNAVVLDPETRLLQSLAFTVDEGYGDHPVSAPLLHRRTLWSMARPVRALPTVPLASGALWSAKVLVLTGDKGFGETDLRALREGEPALGSRPKGGQDPEGPVPIAAAASVKEGGSEAERGGRIVVLGSAQLAQNDTMALFNRDLLLQAISWLADAQRKVMIGPKRPEMFKLVLEEDQLLRLLLVTVVGMPLMALLLGAGVFWIRRG